MSKLLILKASGPDRPDLIAAVSQLLAEKKITPLSFSHTAANNTFRVEMLIDCPPESVVSMSTSLVALGLEVCSNEPEQSENESWVLTVLSRELGADQLRAITTELSCHGLHIKKTTQLTDPRRSTAKIAYEIELTGVINDLSRLRKAFLEQSSTLQADIAIQSLSAYRQRKRLACFDMDSTLIEAEVIDELAKAAGVGEQVAAITESAMQGEIDFQESFKQRMALLKGLDESVLANIASQLPITEGAERLMKTLKAYGIKTAILSGGFNYFGRYLQDKLGFDYVYANQLDIVDGKVTGLVKGDIVDGARKAQLLKEIAQREGIPLQQTIAMGDGANDLPMLSEAALGVAFRAKPIVKASAQYAVSTLGLDGLLYLLGFTDKEILSK